MCCLFGLLDYAGYFNRKQKQVMLSVLSTACEVRGTDATGIAYNSKGLRIYKRPVPAHRMHYLLPPDAAYIMGHIRLTTQGNQHQNYNNHPFRGRTAEGSFALAHNGVIHNDSDLQKKLRLPKTNIETDSYVAVQLLEKEGALNFDSLKAVAEQLRGSFTMTVLDTKDTLSIVKGDNPFCLYHFADRGFYLYASTEEILQTAFKRLGMEQLPYNDIPLCCGDLMQIDSRGKRTTSQFDTDNLYLGHRGYFTPYAYSFYDRFSDWEADEEYVELLKMTACGFGYTPEDVDCLLEEGFSPEEIESYFYELE